MPASAIMAPPARCLVLGGSGYVGSEVCRQLVSHGAQVAFTWNTNRARADEVLATLPGSHALQWDCRVPGSAQALIDDAAFALGGFDVLVQCAGTAGDAALYANGVGIEKFLSIDAAGFAQMMDITAAGTFAACQAAVGIMRHNGGGRIVMVGSMDGIKSVPAPVHYAAAKGALVAMTQAMAKAIGEHHILINGVAPGILDGGIGRLLSEELRADYLKHCALKRLGTAREVAEVVAWLALANTYVTGQTILLDGGL
jgi:3-oxoacyl-[acyl-carrier protein] reductase